MATAAAGGGAAAESNAGNGGGSVGATGTFPNADTGSVPTASGDAVMVLGDEECEAAAVAAENREVGEPDEDMDDVAKGEWLEVQKGKRTARAAELRAKKSSAKVGKTIKSGGK